MVLIALPSDRVQSINGCAARSAADQFETFSLSKFLRSFSDIDWSPLWDIFLIRFLLGFAVIVYRTNIATLMDYQFGATPVEVGFMISYAGIIAAISSFFVGHLAAFYRNDTRLLLHASIVQTLSIGVMPFSTSISFLVIAMTPLGIANAVLRVSSTNVTLERARGHDVGVLMGLGASVISIARMAAPTVGGVAQEFHVCGPGIVGAAIAAIAVLIQIIIPQGAQRQHVD